MTRFARAWRAATAAAAIAAAASCVVGCGRKGASAAANPAAAFADVEGETAVNAQAAAEKAESAAAAAAAASTGGTAGAASAARKAKEGRADSSGREYAKRPERAERGWKASDYVTLGEYEGMALEDPGIEEPTAADVVERAEFLLSEPENFGAVDDAAAIGDVVVVDGAAYVGGDERPVDLDDLTFQLGTGESTDELDAALVGKKAGDEFECEAALPSDLGDGSGGGKIEMKGVVAKVKRRSRLDEAAAKRIMKDPDATQESCVAAIEAQLRLEAENVRAGAILAEAVEKLLETSSVREIPESYLQEWIEETRRDSAYLYAEGGTARDAYLADPERFEEEFREEAEEAAKREMIAMAVAEAEGVDEVSDEEWEETAEFMRALEGIRTAKEWEDWLADGGAGRVERVALRVKAEAAIEAKADLRPAG